LAQQETAATRKLQTWKKHYRAFVADSLVPRRTSHWRGDREPVFQFFPVLAAGQFDDRSHRELLAQGELISTESSITTCKSEGGRPLLPALHFTGPL